MTTPNAPKVVTALPGPNGARVLEKDARYMSPSYTRCYPLVVSRAQGMWVEDVDGNVFLDFTSGVAVCSTGHSHPKVVAAIEEQSRRFLHMAGTDFYYSQQSDLAERLAQITPGSFPKRVFLTNSGAETVEAALKLARYATKRPRMIAFYGAFHGRTMGALSLTASKAVQRRGFAPLLSEVTHVPYAYCYRCPYHLRPDTCEMACARFLEEQVFPRFCPPDEVAAIFVEPIQGEGGYVAPPPAYYHVLREICDKHGILLVADEIQSGLGRTGKWCAIEHWGVVPDIVCFAKGLASGLPIGAMVSRADLNVWDAGAHANTFGGNPVACAAALATLDLIRDGLMENAGRVGTYLEGKLRDLASRHAVVGDVRGKGLMLGIEIIESPRTRAKAHDLRERIVAACFERGLLLLGCGENTIRFCPALIATEREVDMAMGILGGVMDSVAPRAA